MRWPSLDRFSALVVFITIVFAAHVVRAATWHVLPDGSGDAPTIQAAVNLAVTGDIILLAPGTYTGPGNRGVSYGTKGLIIRSEAGAASTIIDCEGAARGFLMNSRGAQLIGVTIVNGIADRGGGILFEDEFPIQWIASGLIRECVITDCTATVGGGICGDDHGAATIEYCTIMGNSATDGGGIAIDDNAKAHVRFNTISGNVASREGGGVRSTSNGFPSEAVLGYEDNLIENNQAARGGGVYARDRGPFDRNRIVGNTASLGAGVQFGSINDFTSNLVANNFGHGIYADSFSNRSIVNCTIVGNQGDGVYAATWRGTLRRCIVAFNGGTAMIVIPTGSGPHIECVDVFGNGSNSTAGTETYVDLFFEDPLFCDTTGESAYRLRDDSPCAPANAPCLQLVGAFPVQCANTPIDFLECPPDTVVAANAAGVALVLQPVTIVNSSITPTLFFYQLSTTGVATLSDGGNPASLIGVTPMLAPTQSYTPPSAVLNVPPGQGGFQQAVSCVVTALPNGPTSQCATTVTFEEPLAVAIQDFRAELDGRSVRLSWRVNHDGEADEIVVRRRLASESPSTSKIVARLPESSSGYIDANVIAGQTYAFDIAVLSQGATLATSMTTSIAVPALSLAFQSVAPNPFQSSTWISFDAPDAAPVTLEVFDVSGRRVRRLVDEALPSGLHRIEWRRSASDGTASGVYFLRLSQGKHSVQTKVTVLK